MCLCSYKWAEVLSADAFSAFEEAGVDDLSAVQKVGKRFRDTVLAFGGGRFPGEVFKASFYATSSGFPKSNCTPPKDGFDPSQSRITMAALACWCGTLFDKPLHM